MSLIAIQGIRGSYSEEAALDIVGEAAILECDDFAAMFEAVRTETAEYAVVPVENKIVGEIAGAMNILRAGGFREYERKPLRVRHVLSGTNDSTLGTIKSVTSHVEALKQCRRFLEAHSEWTQVVGADTASSVRRVVETGGRGLAAISSRRAAEMYGAKILAENIADDPDNWTTFCLIGRSN
jgi:prephenate dehydratase